MNFPDSLEALADFEDLFEPLYPCQLEPAFCLPLEAAGDEAIYESSPQYEYQCSESTSDELGSPVKQEECAASPPATPEEPRRLIGRLTYAERQIKLQHFRAKRLRRVWTRRINYDCRKKVADGRVRYKGRFVKKEDCHLYQPAVAEAPKLT